MVQEIFEKTEDKNRVLESAKKVFDVRDDIIDLFEKRIFPYKDNVFKTEKKEESEGKFDENKFFNYIENETEGINYELLERYFNNVVPSALATKII